MAALDADPAIRLRARTMLPRNAAASDGEQILASSLRFFGEVIEWLANWTDPALAVYFKVPREQVPARRAELVAQLDRPALAVDHQPHREDSRPVRADGLSDLR